MGGRRIAICQSGTDASFGQFKNVCVGQTPQSAKIRGIVIVFVSVGMAVRWDAELSLEDMINEGVRQGYTHPDNVLRGSVLNDPDGARTNTKDNTPAVIHTRIVAGDKVEIEVAAKGGGSEAKAKFAMLNPSDSVVDWVLSVVPSMGAGWCPPGILGVGMLAARPKRRCCSQRKA